MAELNPTPGAAAMPAGPPLAGASMGTTWSVRLGRSGAPTAATAQANLHGAIQAALDELVEQMSTWERHSVISTLNRADPGWYQIPPAFFHVLRHALDIAAQTDGAYDPTVGRLTDLWGFGPGGPISAPPPPARIEAARQATGWRRTRLNAELRGVWQPGDMHFDLSSIAKGHGVDEIARVLNEHGFEHYLAELGGELRARGLNPQGRPWQVDIEMPGQARGLPISLRNSAVATSGDYRRCFSHQGRRYAHTLDPHTGRPLRQKLESVSVLHTRCMMADGLATALLCLGDEQGPAYARKHDIAALFLARHENNWSVEWTGEFLALAGIRPDIAAQLSSR